jgi:hypothetical protein
LAPGFTKYQTPLLEAAACVQTKIAPTLLTASISAYPYY